MAISTGSKGSKQRSLSLAFRNLNIFGMATSASYQMDVFTSLLSIGSAARRLIGSRQDRIRNFARIRWQNQEWRDAASAWPSRKRLFHLLKTIAGEMNGIHTDSEGYLNYQGLWLPYIHYLDPPHTISRYFGARDENSISWRSHLHC